MAVVLAGRPNRGRLREVSDAEWEALIDVAGVPMAARVAWALAEGMGGRGPLVVVGPSQLSRHLPERAVVVAPKEGLLENLEEGLAHFARDDVVLVAAGDAALLGGEHVEAFLKGVERLGEAELWYSIVPKGEVARRFPGMRRTFVRLREGVFTGGNLLALSPRVFGRLKDVAERAVALRKSPIGLARLFGAGFLFRFLLGRVSLAEAEATFARLFRIRGRAVVVPYAEVGIDVDKPSDYRWCTHHLAGRGDAHG